MKTWKIPALGASLLILFLGAAFLWWVPERRITTAFRADHPTPIHPDERAAPQLLEKLLTLHRSVDRGNTDVTPGRFARESKFGLTEGRLLALSFPSSMTAVLDSIASDAARHPQDRFFAIDLLGHLAGSGEKVAEASLARLVLNPDRDISGSAIDRLSETDLHGAYRQLYERKCEAGVIEAFDAMAHWADQGNVILMKRFMGLDRESSSLPDMARRVMDCYDILLSPDWSQTIGKIIRDPTCPKSELTLWAIEVAKARAMPSLIDDLRNRLNAGFEKAREELAQQMKSARRKLPEGDRGVGLEDRYARASVDEFFFDHAHDDALIAYANAGGKLREFELQRLNLFGYFCDPRKRLAELLASKE